MESVQAIKQRFELIGNDPKLNRAIEKALQVAPTDISVLVTGESGVGKEAIPKIIHSLSHRKHAKYIAVNCGAIPEGTIDSELFGHEKGAFTGATQTRSGYFEVADGGTIFLDEVGELPLTTQVRLLRVLENGEFLKVGSSQVQKTDVHIVAATNINMFEAIKKEKFREDLYYRLSTVEINIPPLRERQNDIHLLFRKFASDFGQKYKMPTIRLEDNARELLLKYRWPGNIRQLRNIAEQISVLEEKRNISDFTLNGYLPTANSSNLPAVVGGDKKEGDFSTEREILYKVLNAVYDEGILSRSMRSGVISLIFKKKGDRRGIKNYRPISLLQVDYKILAKVMANRFKQVLCKIVSKCQSCCIPGRDIADTIANIRDVLDLIESEELEGYLLKMDQEKAFDKVGHTYLREVLKKYGFGDRFVNWVGIFYTDIQSSVKSNGFLTKYFKIKNFN